MPPTTDLTYPRELVGVSLAALADDDAFPSGYRRVRMSRRIGLGDDCFERAVGLLMGWDMHRRAGLAVHRATPRAAVGVDVSLGIGPGWLRLHAPCRVVAVVDEPDRRGFAYGTLPGHPESGEEVFVVERRQSRRAGESGPPEVWATIVAFSLPATPLARWSGPFGRRVQDAVTRRYLAALRDS